MVSTHIRNILILVAMLCTLQSGCARFNSFNEIDYRSVETSTVARPKLAHRKHKKGINYLCCKQYDLAEQFLHEALIADASFGPAHNTLGKVYFEQQKFYLAAWEFERAIKTMPERAEPVNNLGLVYEAVGKLDDAVAQYELAVGMNIENAEYLGNLLRCRIRRGEHASMMRSELQHLIALDHRDTWVRWAKLKLTTDRTEQDWRQSDHSQQPLFDGSVYEESPEVIGTYFEPQSLPFETEVPTNAEEVPSILPQTFPTNSEGSGSKNNVTSERLPSLGEQ